MDKQHPEVQKAFQLAIKAQKNSYSPYSHFAVGAALKFKGDPTIYEGCNVENQSFGATICAERSALTQAMSKKGKQSLEFVVVVANTQNPTWPCALCLQVLAEFKDQDFPIFVGNPQGIGHQCQFSDLLPRAFDTLKEGQRPQ